MFIEALRHALTASRAGAGASLEDVARAAGISHPNFSRFETGEQGWPRDPDRYVRAYAQVAGTTEEALWAEALNLFRDSSAARR
jgi:transcriptional regulator with XRE-family HTH domain